MAAQAVAPDGSVLYVDVAFGVGVDDIPDATTATLEDAAASLEADGYDVALAGGPFTAPLELSRGRWAGDRARRRPRRARRDLRVAAGMPILTALLGVGVGLGGAIALPSVVELNTTTPALALMLGLAVGIDYALFIVYRHRGNILQGMDLRESIARAVATAGSAVVFAGATVVIALGALVLSGIPILAEMGLVAAGTVAVTVIVAITVSPAIMGFAGERRRGRALKQAEHSREAKNRWGAFTTSHPVVTLLVGAAVLLTIAIPALSMRLGLPNAGASRGLRRPRGLRDARERLRRRVQRPARRARRRAGGPVRAPRGGPVGRRSRRSPTSPTPRPSPRRVPPTAPRRRWSW